MNGVCDMCDMCDVGDVCEENCGVEGEGRLCTSNSDRFCQIGMTKKEDWDLVRMWNSKVHDILIVSARPDQMM
jgi:hypothetical protein